MHTLEGAKIPVTIGNAANIKAIEHESFFLIFFPFDNGRI